MSRVKMVSEIFEEASKLRLKKDRIDFLRQNQSTLMRYMVQGAYHPNVVWLLPKGTPPHKSAPEMDTYGILHKEFGRLYLFCKGGNDALNKIQREKLFVDLLEILHPSDVRMLCAVKDKKLPYPFLTKALFKEAFPDWLPVEAGDTRDED